MAPFLNSVHCTLCGSLHDLGESQLDGGLRALSTPVAVASSQCAVCGEQFHYATDMVFCRLRPRPAPVTRAGAQRFSA